MGACSGGEACADRSGAVVRSHVQPAADTSGTATLRHISSRHQVSPVPSDACLLTAHEMVAVFDWRNSAPGRPHHGAARSALLLLAGCADQ